jgi:hypothetical protein
MDDLHKVRVALIEDIDKLGRCLSEWPLPTEAVLKTQMRDRRMVGQLAIFDCRISTDVLRSMGFRGAASGPHGLHEGLGTHDGDHFRS